MINYWKNKNMRAEDAVIHTSLMWEKYRPEITASVNRSTIYDEMVCHEDGWVDNVKNNYPDVEDSQVKFIRTDSVSAILDNNNPGDRICVLNFASYTKPGGMYLKGSCAQEESLCSESFLYNVLSSPKIKREFYNKHVGKDAKNNYLYFSDLVYSPSVIFERDENKVTCDVITCAAPNKNACSKYTNIHNVDSVVISHMIIRIESILYAALKQGVDTIVLGAFGCGVFKNNVEDIADIFAQVINKIFKGKFKNIIFAIPSIDGDDCTYDRFAESYTKSTLTINKLNKVK